MITSAPKSVAIIIFMITFLIGCTDPQESHERFMEDQAAKYRLEANLMRMCYAIYPSNFPENPPDKKCLADLRKENEAIVKEWVKSNETTPQIKYKYRCDQPVALKDLNQEGREECLRTLKELYVNRR